MRKTKIDKKYHYLLLIAIPMLWVLNYFIGGHHEFNVLAQKSYLIFTRNNIGISISIILGLKSFFYFYTRHYPIASLLCWVDILLTLLLPIMVLYDADFHYKFIILDREPVASLIPPVIISWFAIQIFLAGNFFALNLSKRNNLNKIDI